MRFWDSSALVPLLVVEPSTDRAVALLKEDPKLVVWWGSPVECSSAIARREREKSLSVSEAASALERLSAIESRWNEIQPSDPLRRIAQRLLRVHPLRTADSLQLAAAIAAAEHEPAALTFVSLDLRLNEAAAREGFKVEDLS